MIEKLLKGFVLLLLVLCLIAVPMGAYVIRQHGATIERQKTASERDKSIIEDQKTLIDKLEEGHENTQEVIAFERATTAEWKKIHGLGLKKYEIQAQTILKLEAQIRLLQKENDLLASSIPVKKIDTKGKKMPIAKD